jgi:hypothetical protein
LISAQSELLSFFFLFLDPFLSPVPGHSTNDSSQILQTGEASVTSLDLEDLDELGNDLAAGKKTKFVIDVQFVHPGMYAYTARDPNHNVAAIGEVLFMALARCLIQALLFFDELPLELVSGNEQEVWDAMEQVWMAERSHYSHLGGDAVLLPGMTWAEYLESLPVPADAPANDPDEPGYDEPFPELQSVPYPAAALPTSFSDLLAHRNARQCASGHRDYDYLGALVERYRNSAIMADMQRFALLLHDFRSVYTAQEEFQRSLPPTQHNDRQILNMLMTGGSGAPALEMLASFNRQYDAITAQTLAAVLEGHTPAEIVLPEFEYTPILASLRTGESTKEDLFRQINDRIVAIARDDTVAPWFSMVHD